MKPYDILIARPNSKMGEEVMIINTSSAMNCPSDKRGLCKNSKICYAKPLETLRKRVFEFHERQGKYFSETSVPDLWEDIENFLKIPTGRKIKYLRWNAFGDFKDAEDIHKADMLSEALLIGYGIKSWAYTARKDLEEEFKKCQVLRPLGTYWNGPGGMAIACHERDKGSILVANPLAPKADPGEPTEMFMTCPGKCKACGYRCVSEKPIYIAFPAHGSNRGKFGT